MSDNRVLFVDDDPKILAAIERQLEENYEIETALGPLEGLKAVQENGPFALVISDMRMPEMTGIDMLTKISVLAPDTVRMMLTGFADLETTIDAINRGSIFRFLAKPCPNEILELAIKDGLRQHQLMLAEKQLVQGTLMGSVKVLSDVLGLVNPVSFGRASRVKRIAMEVAKHMKIEPVWEIEIASMLSTLGCVTLPAGTFEKLNNDRPLTTEERECFERHPEIGKGLLENVPRLENVAQIVAYQEKQFDGGGVPVDSVKGLKIPLGARILKAALDFDTEENRCSDPIAAFARQTLNAHRYDPAVLSALNSVIDTLFSLKIVDVSLPDLRVGMVLAESVGANDGRMLIAKGHDVTDSVLNFLHNYAAKGELVQPIRIFQAPDD